MFRYIFEILVSVTLLICVIFNATNVVSEIHETTSLAEKTLITMADAVEIRAKAEADAALVESVIQATRQLDDIAFGNQYDDGMLVLDYEREWSPAVTPYYNTPESADALLTYSRHECREENVPNSILRKAFQCEG